MEQKDSAERILKQIPYEIVYSARKNARRPGQSGWKRGGARTETDDKIQNRSILKRKTGLDSHTPGKSVGGRRAESSEPSDGSRTKSGG